MRKFSIILLTLSFINFSTIEKSHAMSARIKALITMPAYGAGGGALLGFASMAFGAKPKAIAQGASLGLYAGLIFATYILVSYKYRNSVPAGSYPDDAPSPYADEGDPYSNEGGGDDPYADDAPQLWEPVEDNRLELKFGRPRSFTNPTFHMNLVNLEF